MVDADIAYENVVNMRRHFAPMNMLTIMEFDIDRTRGIQLFSDSIGTCIKIYCFVFFFVRASQYQQISFFSLLQNFLQLTSIDLPRNRDFIMAEPYKVHPLPEQWYANVHGWWTTFSEKKRMP